jgi:hypothetical protein
VTDREAQINDLTQALAERDDRIAALNQQVQIVEGSRSWRMTKPLRDVRRAGVTILKKGRDLVLLLRTRGLRYVIGRVGNRTG